MAIENMEKVEIGKDDWFSDPMLFQLMPLWYFWIDSSACLCASTLHLLYL